MVVSVAKVVISVLLALITLELLRTAVINCCDGDGCDGCEGLVVRGRGGDMSSQKSGSSFFCRSSVFLF